MGSLAVVGKMLAIQNTMDTINPTSRDITARLQHKGANEDAM